MLRKACVLSFGGLVLTLGLNPIAAQVVPSAKRNIPALEIGSGVSVFHPDFGSGTMLGYSVWADYAPGILAQIIPGLAIEAQFKDIGWHRSASQQNVDEKTFLGGAKYSWNQYKGIYPFVASKVGYGSIDFFNINFGSYTHDTRTIYSFSGGAQYKIQRHVWAHCDYEYQIWPFLFGRTFEPRGFTFGLAYDFSVRPRRF